MWRGLALFLVLCGPSAADPCAPGADLQYSSLDRIARIQPSYGLTDALRFRPDPQRTIAEERADIAAAFAAEFAGVDPQLADVQTIVLFINTVNRANGFSLTRHLVRGGREIEPILAALERQGLDEPAQVLRQAMALFGDWDGSSIESRRQAFPWTAANGAVLQRRFQAVDETFLHAWPAVLDFAGEALSRPEVAAAVAAAETRLTDHAHLNFVMTALRRCLPARYPTFQERLQAMDRLPTLQAELLRLEEARQVFLFIDETLNEGWLDEQIETFPALLPVLRRYGFELHAEGLSRLLAATPDEVMAGELYFFELPDGTREDISALYAAEVAGPLIGLVGRDGSGLTNDFSGPIQSMMIDLAKASALWPMR